MVKTSSRSAVSAALRDEVLGKELPMKRKSDDHNGFRSKRAKVRAAGRMKVRKMLDDAADRAAKWAKKVTAKREVDG